ncbi:MAG: LysM peptidoglycan-binding domain-containing protein [Clostridiales bacterium]|nr:LysM peptidoglycan-binding domain-containing protein [Clostridiales bacterium]
MKNKNRNRKLNKKNKVGGYGYFLVLAILIILFGFNNNSLSKTEIKYEDFTIGSNDSLWNIATLVKENNINYNKKDVREIVYELKQINNLDNSDIYNNQVIKIPEI